MVASGADIGLALDGDADRLIVVDEKGRLVDGDQLMALIALGLQARGELKGGAVVATVMSNLGLERKLGEHGITLVRTAGRRPLRARGDAHGAAAMSAASNPGTSSLPTIRPPATGWSRGFRCLPLWSRPKTPASDLLRQFEPLPQLLKNVRFNGGASRSRPTASGSASRRPKPSSRAAAAS